MNFSERKLRVVGYLVFASTFFIFFMMEMFFSWKDENMLLKLLFLTFGTTILIWEPTRFLILFLRRRCPGPGFVKRRLALASLILVPYSFLVGFTRIYLEDIYNYWGVPVANITQFSYSIGVTLLFALLQLTVYEGIYFLTGWKKTLLEAEQLKRLNVTMQMDSLKLQIQPHFLFNTLNTLIGLIEMDQKRAVWFTENLSFVYRYLLEATETNLIDLDKELDFTKRYFSLLKTRYPEGLYLHESIGDTTGFQIPPLTLQILIENAVKHNKITVSKPLYIYMEYDDLQNRIIVSNNLQPKYVPGTTGMGLLHLKKKFQLMNLPELRVKSDDKEFTVSFPLIKTNSYEGAYN